MSSNCNFWWQTIKAFVCRSQGSWSRYLQCPRSLSGLLLLGLPQGECLNLFVCLVILSLELLSDINKIIDCIPVKIRSPSSRVIIELMWEMMNGMLHLTKKKKSKNVVVLLLIRIIAYKYTYIYIYPSQSCLHGIIVCLTGTWRSCPSCSRVGASGRPL